MIGIASKELVSPAEILRSADGSRFAQPAQVLEVPIRDPVMHQISGKPVAVELRIESREWDSPNVDELCNAAIPEQIQELLRGVP
jgi:hypothetical protein